MEQPVVTSRASKCSPGKLLLARWFVAGTYFIALVLLIVTSVELRKSGEEAHILAWFIAGVFVIMAVPLSAFQMYQHLRHFHRPKLQRYVVRIILMVPIYAVESWLSLRFKESALYIETAREAYEAFVIYSFLYFLIAYLGEEEQLNRILRQKPMSRAKHLAGFCCLRSWRLDNGEFMRRCKVGTLQYVVVKLACACLTVVMEWSQVYGDGEFRYDRAWPYVTFISNCSQVWAMYCLVLFYQATKEELAPVKPFRKFCIVKAVVFFSFWQSVGISLLVHMKIITHTVTYTTDDVARGMQDFLICVEMFIAAVAHHYTFSHKDFPPPDASTPRAPFMRAFIDSTLPLDILQDMRSVVVDRSRRSRFVSGSSTGGVAVATEPALAQYIPEEPATAAATSPAATAATAVASGSPGLAEDEDEGSPHTAAIPGGSGSSAGTGLLATTTRAAVATAVTVAVAAATPPSSLRASTLRSRRSPSLSPMAVEMTRAGAAAQPSPSTFTAVLPDDPAPAATATARAGGSGGGGDGSAARHRGIATG